MFKYMVQKYTKKSKVPNLKTANVLICKISHSGMPKTCKISHSKSLKLAKYRVLEYVKHVKYRILGKVFVTLRHKT